MDITDRLSGNVLYFPTIEIVDETWLKAALCVWDKVYRIVPETYAPKDSNDVAEAVDAGVLVNEHLSKADLVLAGAAFAEFWDTVPMTPADVTGYENVRLHVDKVDARVLPLLESLSVAVGSHDFLSVSPQVADTYMLFLARTVSQRRSMPKLTDNQDMFALMQYFDGEGQFDEGIYSTEVAEAMIAVTLPSVLPGGIEYTALRNVLAFREATVDLRSAYRKTLLTTTEALVNVADEHHARQVLSQFESDLRAQGAGMKGVLGKMGLDCGFGMLSIGLPTALTAMGTILATGAGVSTRSVFGSLVVGCVASLADSAKSIRASWRPPDSLYHMRLHDEFLEGEELRLVRPRYDRAFEEFIND